MTTKPKSKTFTSEEVSKMRAKLGLNQSQFWGRLGVTQSSGSRYESGRKIPHPIQKLIQIAYGTEKQAADLVAELRTAKGKRSDA